MLMLGLRDVCAISLLIIDCTNLPLRKRPFQQLKAIDYCLSATRYIEPRWGHFRLGAVRTIQVEEWLDSLALAPSSPSPGLPFGSLSWHRSGQVPMSRIKAYLKLAPLSGQSLSSP